MALKAGLARRYRRERMFKTWGVLSIAFSILCLAVLFTDITSKGHGAFLQTYVRIDVTYDQDVLELTNIHDEKQFALANFDGLVKQSLQQRFPEASGRKDKRELKKLISSGAGYQLADRLRETPSLLGNSESVWVLADDDIDTYYKSLDDDEGAFTGKVGEKIQRWVGELQETDDIELRFNTTFFSNGDSREPEQAGIWGAVKGSFFTLMVTLALSFPIGVAAALYLEEFAPKNKWTDFIEVNINNLAAVPSIIFGLLGLAIFINFFQVPRSIPISMLNQPKILSSSTCRFPSNLD